MSDFLVSGLIKPFGIIDTLGSTVQLHVLQACLSTEAAFDKIVEDQSEDEVFPSEPKDQSEEKTP